MKPDPEIEALVRRAQAAGGKVLGTVVPGRDASDFRRMEEIRSDAAGTLIVGFQVPMRPVPWKVATVLKSGHSFKDRKLVAWQEEVARCARAAMRGRAPYEGPVRVAMAFYLTSRSGSPPDLTNLIKSTEDSIQGVAILNDRRVLSVQAWRFLRSDRDYASIHVFASEEQ